MLDFFKYFPWKYIHSKSSQIKVWILDPKLFQEGDCKIEEVWSWKKVKYEKFVIWKEGTGIKIKKVEEEIRKDYGKENNQEKNQPDKTS